MEVAMTKVTVMIHNQSMVHNNHLMTNQDRIINKALTVTTATTKQRTKNMNVEQVHSKASSLALSNSVMLKSSMIKEITKIEIEIIKQVHKAHQVQQVHQVKMEKMEQMANQEKMEQLADQEKMEQTLIHVLHVY